MAPAVIAPAGGTSQPWLLAPAIPFRSDTLARAHYIASCNVGLGGQCTAIRRPGSINEGKRGGRGESGRAGQEHGAPVCQVDEDGGGKCMVNRRKAMCNRVEGHTERDGCCITGRAGRRMGITWCMQG